MLLVIILQQSGVMSLHRSYVYMIQIALIRVEAVDGSLAET